MEQNILLKMVDINKSFPGVKALNGVHFLFSAHGQKAKKASFR